MKNIYIYLAIALAVLAFSACSNGDDGTEGNPSSSSKGGSKQGVCYIPNVPDARDLKMCAEGITESLTKADCDELSYETGYTANYQNSCPSGQKLKCLVEDENGNGAGYFYIYGQVITDLDFTCATFGYADADGGGSRPSSASKPSSNSNSGSGACYFDYDDGDGECYEFTTETITRYECMDEGGTFMASCPSGQQLKCVDYDLIGYYYGQMWVGQTCNSLGW